MSGNEKPDANGIARALDAWFQPGDVFEVRVLGVRNGPYAERTLSGYFDYDHVNAVAEEIAAIGGYAGAYVTVNPVNPDLLARACNRLKRAVAATADRDIVSRRWLLIDCDAVRPAGIPGSDAEHERAMEVAQKIKGGMAALGWPDPVVTDSGNGAQLMYRVNLPADDGGLCKRVTEEIAKASTADVKVDLTVHNAARIWRLPGTWNRKGDGTADRPHRMARIVSLPQPLVAVTREMLEGILPADSPAMPEESECVSEIRGFDLDSWIQEHLTQYGIAGPVPYDGGRKWILHTCPFNEAHTNKSAVLIQRANGAVGFKCHHDSCAGNNWRKLRETLEPGCYDRKAEDPGVDLSGILAGAKGATEPVKAAENAAEEAEPESNPWLPEKAPFPERLLNVPGLVNDIIDFDLKTAPCPNPALALAGALVLMGHLIGRKMRLAGGARPSVYIVSLGKSGIGKDHPRKVNKEIVRAMGITKSYSENMASGQALEDRLIATNPLLWMCDEFHAVLREITRDTKGTKENMLKTLLGLYSTADSFTVPRDKVGRAPGEGEIRNPILNLLASCTPGNFFDSIDVNVIGHGMYSRMVVIPASPEGKPQQPGNLQDIPKTLYGRAKAWVDYKPEGSGNLDIRCRDVPVAPDAVDYMAGCQLEAKARGDEMEAKGAPEWACTIWTRVYENMMRFALIYACSAAADRPGDAVLTRDAVEWAHDLLFWEAENKIRETDEHYYETDFARTSGRVVEVLTAWRKGHGDAPMPGNDFNRRLKQFPPKVLAAVIESLDSQDRIEVFRNTGVGRSGRKYRLKGK